MGFTNFVLLVSSLLLAHSVFAIPLVRPLPDRVRRDVTLGEPTYGGSGCPSSSASTSLSPDGTSLSVIFDGFSVTAGGSSGRYFSRKNCDTSIPVTVPNGYRVAVVGIDYRGGISVPCGAFFDFTADYVWDGTQTPLFVQRFVGERTGDYTISHEMNAESTSFSDCGASVTLRLDTAIQVTTNAASDQIDATVDSIDASTVTGATNPGMVFYLTWEKC